MAICKNCNSIVADDAAFCLNCGAPMNNQTNTNQTNNIIPNTPAQANNEDHLHQVTMATVNRYFSEVLNQPLPENNDTRVNLDDILIKTNSAEKYIHNFPYLFGLFFGCLIVLELGSITLGGVLHLQFFNPSGSGGLIFLAIILIISIIVSVILFLFLLNRRANLRFSFKNNIETYQYLRNIIIDNNLHILRANIHTVYLQSKAITTNAGAASFTRSGSLVEINFSNQKIVVSAQGIAFKKLFPGLMELEKEFI